MEAAHNNNNNNSPPPPHTHTNTHDAQHSMSAAAAVGADAAPPPEQPPAPAAPIPAPAAPAPAAIVPLQLPDDGSITQAFCAALRAHLHSATWVGVEATAEALPASVLAVLLQRATAVLSKEPTLVEILPSASQQRVTVVGDTHGQFHDLCRLFEQFGPPASERVYIFNGDYVDRGAWGVEVLALLLAYKLLLPKNVFILRGNHESSIITQLYGFFAELTAKYGKAAKGLFTHIRRLFAAMPLAALVERSTLILHGGLFRAPPTKKAGAKRRQSGVAGAQQLTVGTLDDLRAASKGAQDPDPDRSIKNLVASDCMWSDPVNAPGMQPNEARGVGTSFGPDVTETFLSQNGLKLIIRSHEGPDARDKRAEGDRMPSVDSGYSVDHDTPSGKLCTIFSSPDYPQFLPEGEERFNNKGAVLHLTAPDWATPDVESFEAVLPRPQVESYYVAPAYSEDDEEGDEHDGDAQEEQQQHGQPSGSPAQGGDGGGGPPGAAAAAADTAAEAADAEAGPSGQEVAAGAAEPAAASRPAATGEEDAGAAAAGDRCSPAGPGGEAQQLVARLTAQPPGEGGVRSTAQGGGVVGGDGGGGDAAAAAADGGCEQRPSKRHKLVAGGRDVVDR